MMAITNRSSIKVNLLGDNKLRLIKHDFSGNREESLRGILKDLFPVSTLPKAEAGFGASSFFVVFLPRLT